MRDRVDGVRRAVLRRSVLARTRRFRSSPSLQAQSWAPHTAHCPQQCDCAREREGADGCPRRAQRPHGCPRAQRARACCQEPAGSRAVRRLCINQILAARPTAESWGPSTPSTRHLLDGVAVPVPHRVLVEKGLRAPNLRTGPNERSVRTRRNAIFPPSSARASASSRRRASAS